MAIHDDGIMARRGYHLPARATHRESGEGDTAADSGGMRARQLVGARRRLFSVQDEEQEAQETRLFGELGEQLAGFRHRVRLADD